MNRIDFDAVLVGINELTSKLEKEESITQKIILLMAITMLTTKIRDDLNGMKGEADFNGKTISIEEQARTLAGMFPSMVNPGLNPADHIRNDLQTLRDIADKHID